VWRPSCHVPDGCLEDRVLDARIAFLITDILSDDGARIPTFGEESALKLTRPAAAKTGTTTDYRDNWTVGYTPDLVVGVWVGNADNEVMKNVSGATGAAPLWHDVMEIAHRGLPVHAFVRPEGMATVEVCAVSGKRPTEDCPHRVVETFIAGTEPTEHCDMHRRVGEQVYLVLPPEAQAWGRDQGIPQPPPQVQRGVEPPILLLTSPDDGAIYHIDATLPRSRQKIRVTTETEIELIQLILFVDGRPIADFEGPPYATLWQLVPGEHTFQARGVGEDKSEITSETVTIRVRP
jgi:membrane carboxypeptidase/penicillin-binding protein PbpC